MLGSGTTRIRSAALQEPSRPILSSERLDDRIVVRVDADTFTCYRFGPGQKYPYLYPVNSPASGLSLTTESSLPYPHHRSLFFGCDKVNGGNYWQEGNELGQIVSTGPEVTQNGPDVVRIEDRCEWRRPGQKPIIEDRRELRIHVPSRSLRFIDFAIRLTALTDIDIQRTNHALFSARVDPALSVKAGGSLVNAGGAASEKGTYGAPSPWCDYSGRRFGFTEGIAIFDSPANPWFPCRWFTRDYGFFSPTPMEWLGPEGLRLKQGEGLQLTYRVVAHTGDAAKARIPELFQQWKSTEEARTGLRRP
jgi:hypothetical protein